jgi:Cu2+-exporting ATPase
MFVFFLLSGRYFEMMARQKAARSVETLARAIPAFATRFLQWPEPASERVAVAELNVGDRVQIKPGETIPAEAPYWKARATPTSRSDRREPTVVKRRAIY